MKRYDQTRQRFSVKGLVQLVSITMALAGLSMGLKAAEHGGQAAKSKAPQEHGGEAAKPKGQEHGGEAAKPKRQEQRQRLIKVCQFQGAVPCIGLTTTIQLWTASITLFTMKVWKRFWVSQASLK